MSQMGVLRDKAISLSPRTKRCLVEAQNSTHTFAADEVERDDQSAQAIVTDSRSARWIKGGLCWRGLEFTPQSMDFFVLQRAPGCFDREAEACAISFVSEYWR